MDPILGSGDTNRSPSRSQPGSPRYTGTLEKEDNPILDDQANNESGQTCEQEKPTNRENNSPRAIEDHEMKLKDRITQCRQVIESLKLELSEEKAKLEKDTKSQNAPAVETLHNYSSQTVETLHNYSSQTVETLHSYSSGPTSGGYSFLSNVPTSSDILGDLSLNTDMYSACVDSKLNCDENLKEYERQLEKYQTTLNMAQIEKKNAIRKQNLAKAYKLKLLELENQCNIELLRVKQSLQCLEPLQMIASKWKIGADEGSYDLDKFELMPCYPEISSASAVDVEAVKDEPVKTDTIGVKDVVSSD